jgi:hypothetical protein
MGRQQELESRRQYQDKEEQNSVAKKKQAEQQQQQLLLKKLKKVEHMIIDIVADAGKGSKEYKKLTTKRKEYMAALGTNDKEQHQHAKKDESFSSINSETSLQSAPKEKASIRRKEQPASGDSKSPSPMSPKPKKNNVPAQDKEKPACVETGREESGYSDFFSSLSNIKSPYHAKDKASISPKEQPASDDSELPAPTQKSKSVSPEREEKIVPAQHKVKPANVETSKEGFGYSHSFSSINGETSLKSPCRAAPNEKPSIRSKEQPASGDSESPASTRNQKAEFALPMSPEPEDKNAAARFKDKPFNVETSISGSGYSDFFSSLSNIKSPYHTKAKAKVSISPSEQPASDDSESPAPKPRPKAEFTVSMSPETKGKNVPAEDKDKPTNVETSMGGSGYCDFFSSINS